MTSSFGWLDFDQREADQMLEVFAAFAEKRTIDSLGLGAIRDGIADELFPGLSTVQTRARYFLFVPWICQRLENERVASNHFDRRLRELEVALIEALRQREGPDQGVIGYRAGARLSRLPTSVYWNGLGAFGLRQLEVSLAEYRGLAGRLAGRTSASLRDDAGDRLPARRSMWSDGLSELTPARFLSEPLTLTLTRPERELLADRIATRQPETMIGQLARDLTLDRDTPTPWEVPLEPAGPHLSQALEHARNFSELMEGAQALYNLTLARRAQTRLKADHGELIEALTAQLDGWSNTVSARAGDLRRWLDDGRFWAFIDRRARSRPTQRFVMDWAALALDRPQGLADSQPAQALITARELHLKRGLARLSHDRALESWNGTPLSPGRLTYRWPQARRILDDLQRHEETP